MYGVFINLSSVEVHGTWKLTSARFCVHVVFVWTWIYMIWDQQPSWTHYKWTTLLSALSSRCNLWCFQQRLPVPLVVQNTQSLRWPWRKYLQGFMSKEHGVHDYPHLKCSGNWFGRTWLPSTLWRMWKMTFVVMWAYTSCCKNVVSTCPAPWIIRIGDVPLIFMMPSINIGPVRTCLLIAHHIIHFAEWSDISMCALFLRDLEPNFPISCPWTHLRWIWAESVSCMQSEVAAL